MPFLRRLKMLKHEVYKFASHWCDVHQVLVRRAVTVCTLAGFGACIGFFHWQSTPADSSDTNSQQFAATDAAVDQNTDDNDPWHSLRRQAD